MSVSAPSKLVKVPLLVKQLQVVCEELADAKTRFADIKGQIDALEVGSFSTTYDTVIKAVDGMGHIDGAMVDWTIGQLTTLMASYNGPAVDNLRSGQL
jgi:hypothetical protein